MATPVLGDHSWGYLLVVADGRVPTRAAIRASPFADAAVASDIVRAGTGTRIAGNGVLDDQRSDLAIGEKSGSAGRRYDKPE